MPTDSELLHTWRSVPNRPNILVLAPSEAAYLSHVTEMRDSDGCEVVHVKSGEAAIRLLRRGVIAVLLVDGQGGEPGGLELIVEALAKEEPPSILVMSAEASVRGAHEARRIRPVRVPTEKEALQKLIRKLSKEAGEPRSGVSVAELLEAVQWLPDHGWLRITGGARDTGDLCVQAGRAVYAEHNDKKGNSAAALISRWRDCQFEWRELPPYLQGNLDIPLAHLLSGTPDDLPATVAASGPSPAATFVIPRLDNMRADPADRAELEEPADFTLESALLANSDPDASNLLLDLPGDMDWVCTPEPVPDPVTDWSVEEPSELSLDFSSFDALPMAGVPEVASASKEAVAAATPSRTEAMPVQSPLFLATAILPETGSALESCCPSAEAANFDVVWLRNHYQQAADYMLRRHLGEITELPLLTSTGGVLLAPLGDGRILAVRLRSSEYGREQRQELQRLREMVLLLGLPALL